MAEGKHGTVLVVDDAVENIHTLADILREDYAPLAATMVQALQRFAAQQQLTEPLHVLAQD